MSILEVREKAVVVTLAPDPSELLELCGSLGLEVLHVFVQRLDRPDPRGFVGPGKLREIAEYVAEQGAGLCVFNGELSPAAMFRVEKTLGATVYDRVRLILEIFRRQAASEEARLQVEMAVLTQELPVLREWVHKAKVGEHPGLMAGGEYDVRQYYTARSRRKKDLGRRLAKLARQRELRREARVRLGLRTVSLAGYTNAGKTALMNEFTEVGRPSEERLFTTLSTTTRRVKGLPFPVLLSDTIGFMEDLPPWLLESFRSTLEEVFRSDLMLLVVDASDGPEEMERKLRASAQAIWTMGSSAAILPVFNKSDLIGNQGAGGAKGPGRHIRGVLEDCLSGWEGRGGGEGEGKGTGLHGARSLVLGMLGAMDGEGGSPGGCEEGGDDEGNAGSEGARGEDVAEGARGEDAAEGARGEDAAKGEKEMGAVLPPVIVSAKTGAGIDMLLAAIGEATKPGDEVTVTLDAAWNWRGALSLLHDSADVAVKDVEEGGRVVKVRLLCEPAGLARALKAIATKYGVTPVVATMDDG